MKVRLNDTMFGNRGAEAFGEVYFQAFHRLVVTGEEQDLFISGRYVDRYKKVRPIDQRTT